MIFSPELLITAAAIVIAAVVSTLLFVKQARASAKLRRECEALQELVSHVRREAHSAVAYGSDVGKRLRKAEKDLAQITQRLGQVEMSGDTRAFERAIHVARQGVEADDLMTNFGISRGEAELMSIVHGKSAAAG